MPKISTVDARGNYTKMLVAVYRNRRKPQAFLRSFFTQVESDTLELSIEVQRGTEKIAYDVQRGTGGNRNVFNKSTEKIFVPPFYKEFFDVTDMDLYDRLFNDTEVDSAVVVKFINKAASKLMELQDKIERAIELQCSQVLETGTVTLKNGVIINYGRKAASLVNPGGGHYWADAGVDPYIQLESDCQFIRDEGLVATETFNLIMGSTAWQKLKNNAKFIAQQNLFNLKLDEVAPPQAKAKGGTLHGKLTVGPYTVYLWTYQGTYRDANNVRQFYVNPKKVILLPDTTEYVLAYGAVPQIVRNGDQPSIGIKKGAFVFSDFIDLENTTHTYNITSAPLAIPVAIDTTVTRTVVGN
jgi:hypothetical protein